MSCVFRGEGVFCPAGSGVEGWSGAEADEQDRGRHPVHRSLDENAHHLFNRSEVTHF